MWSSISKRPGASGPAGSPYGGPGALRALEVLGRQARDVGAAGQPEALGGPVDAAQEPLLDGDQYLAHPVSISRYTTPSLRSHELVAAGEDSSIRHMDDIIHSMDEAPGALIPIFRSGPQLELLGRLFLDPDRESSIAQLVRTTGIPQATVSREIDRLARADLVTTRSVGRTKLVRANTDSPFFGELQSLLLKTLGPASLLASALQEIDGVDEAYIFGSWARRYAGELGPAPADIDVVIIGRPNVDEVDAASKALEERVDWPINPVVIAPSDWASAPTGFIRQIRKEPLYPLLEKDQGA
jgi:predicted nucleotidyltransferase